MTETKTVRCGVPQKSNLGPQQFLLYICDSPNCIKTTNAVIFADDTSLSCEGTNSLQIEQKLNLGLGNVYIRLLTNKLTLNKEKTEYVIIGARQKFEAFLDNDPVLTIGEQTIKRVSNKKVLGVVIDEQLKWDKHNEEQCKTKSRNISLLKKAKPFVPQDTLITMYTGSQKELLKHNFLHSEGLQSLTTCTKDFS